MSVQVEKWLFTVDEYSSLTDAGILSEEDRVELIKGEIIRISPIGKRRAACVKRINASLSKRSMAQLSIISIHNPIRLDDYSEPEPDIVLLKPRDDFYAQELASAADVLLIIEVADTSVEYDRAVKLPLYAMAGVPEVWLANLVEDQIEAYGRPVGGKYQDVRIVKRGESLSPRAFPDLVLSFEEIVG